MEKLAPYRPGQLLVRLKSDRQPAFTGSTVLDRFDLNPVRGDEQQGPILKLALPQGTSVEQALQQLGQHPDVAYAVPNHLIQVESRPNDWDERLYGLRNIQAPQAWEMQKGSRQGPLLGMMDSGVDYRHADLAANLWTNPGEIPNNGIDDDHNGVVDDVHGFNAVKRDGDPMDSGSHGTHTAGTVAAVGNNGLGITGVAQQGQLLACKFIDGGMGDISDAIAALLYADRMGVRITNNSWGGSNYNQALYDTLKASPALHICAAGNDGSNNDVAPAYPASFDLPNLVSVAAVDRQRNLTSFSNFGATTVDLAAPGDKILSTVPGQDYAFKSGTSMASPHVAGTALLIATQYPQLTNEQIKDRLIFGCDRLEGLEGKLINGGGHLNAASSLEDDGEAPAGVREMRVGEGLTPRLLPLEWLAPGDDGLEGKAAAYEVRLSPRPFESEEDFRKAPAVATSPPARAGSPEKLQIPLVPFGQSRDLHVAVRAVDNVGNRGPLEQLQVAVPAARVAFYDDGENGMGQWTATGSWGLMEAPGRGNVWADSPQGDYQCDQETSLTSQPFSLRGFEKPQLSFDCRHDLEINFDKVFLEASRDGQHWQPLDSYNLRIGWEKRSYDLSAYREGDCQLRFRLKTDPDVTKDGFYFDNLVVSEEQ